MAAPLFSEPRGSPTGGESVTATPYVGGERPTGFGFGSPFATAASEAATRHGVVPDLPLNFRPT